MTASIARRLYTRPRRERLSAYASTVPWDHLVGDDPPPLPHQRACPRFPSGEAGVGAGAQQTALSHITENRKVEAPQPLMVRDPMFGCCL